MGKKKQDSMQALRNEMEIFVREVFSGKYDEHPEVKGKPVLDNSFLISEIRKSIGSECLIFTASLESDVHCFLY